MNLHRFRPLCGVVPLKLSCITAIFVLFAAIVGTSAQQIKPDGHGGPGWVQTFTNVSSSGSPSNYLGPVTFYVSVDPSTCGPNVPVGVYDSGTWIGTATLNSSGTGSITTTSLAVGSHSITASFPGSIVNGTQCLSSTSLPALTQVVNPAPPAISGLSPTSGAVWTPVMISGTGFGASQGTVTFSGTAASILSWNNTSIVAVVPVGTTTGSVVVTVSGVASNGVTFTIETPTISTQATLAVSPSQTVPYGTNIQLSGSINPITSGSNMATGTIGFYDSGILLGSASISGGQASISVSSLEPGAHFLRVQYSGDGNFISASAGTWPGAIMVATASATVLPPWGDITTVAGVGNCHDYNGDNFSALSACLEAADVAVDQSGNIYFADVWNNVVRKVTFTTGIVTTIAGIGGNSNYGYNGDNQLASRALLSSPRGVAVDANGNVYVADTNNNRIRVIYSAGTVPNVSNPQPGYIYTVAGNSAQGYNQDNQLATNADLYYPSGVALDVAGNIYFADNLNARIRVVYASGKVLNVSNPTAGYIYTVAGTGQEGFNNDGQSAISAQLNLCTFNICGGPQSQVALDGYGNLYIADDANNRIRIVYSGGTIPNVVNPTVGYIYTVAGTGQAGYNGDDQSGIVTQLSGPGGVAVDGFGNIYIGDSNNHRVREVYSSGAIPNVSSPTAGYVYTIAGTGSAGYNGDNIVASGAKLNYPWGLALDGSGNLYIGDLLNYRVRAVGGQLTAGTLAPLYKVFSILYSPPGNQSTQGYGSSTTNSTTTTVGTSFQQSYQVGFNSQGCVSACGTPSAFTIGGGGTVTYANTSGNSYAFTTQVTNATTLTSGDNSSPAFNPTSSDEDNHGLDDLQIWLNPLVTIYSNGNTPVSYSMSSIPITVNGVPLPWADIVGVPAFTMEAWPAGVTNPYLNPTGIGGVTTVPVDLLKPLPISQNSQFSGPAFMAGLGAICAKNTLYQQQLAADLANPGNPAQICTQANQCGCTPADFSAILQEDPLLNYNSATFTASPYAGWVSPLQVDNSGAVACGLNTVSTSSDCRYVVDPALNTNTPGSGSQNAVPWTFLMEGGIQSPGYTYTDGTTSAETITGTTSTTVAISFSIGVPLFTLKTQDQWTWTDTHSIGNSSGIANSMSVTLKSSNSSCDEEVSLFEDTEFHTFVFQVPPASQTGCN